MSADGPRTEQRVTLSKTITAADIEAFGELSMDRNPVHFDDDYASRTLFGRRIAHGLISAALISGALTELMGSGNVWLSLNLDFIKPVFVGDQVRCELTLQEIDRRNVATIGVEIRNSAAEKVISGTVRSMRTSR